MSTVPRCYHCNEDLPQGSELKTKVAGKVRLLCSQNCLTTVEWIEKTGLADYYRLRSGPNQRFNSIDNSHWQNTSLLQQVLHEHKDGDFEVSLLVDGMHCAGCVWLIERVLLKLGGVSDIQINPVTRRAVLKFNPKQTRLADILEALSYAGYRPRPLERQNLDDSRTEENRDLLKRLLVAGFGMMQVMTYAFVLYMENFGELPGGTKELFRWLGFLVSTPVVFYSAAPFFRNARSSLRMKALNMDVPISIAIAAVYGASVYQAMMFQGEVYFESVTMLVFFLLTGRYLEMRARHRSVDSADALVQLTPAFAQRVKADGQLETVPIAALNVGDTVRVMEGSHIPADGILLSTQTLLDESLLSGEASARQRLKDDAVIAGSMVHEGPIEIKLTRVGSDTFLATLANLSNKAQTQRPKLTRRSERITANFVLRVLIITFFTLLGWLWYDPSKALDATIALLVVACPCALGLAAPAAITRAMGVLAKKNVLVINPDSLETLVQVNTAVFDKTGTLTEPSLDSLRVDKKSLQLAASLARESQHPLSRALVAANTLPVLVVSETKSFPGLGLEAQVDGKILRLGQPRFVLAESLVEQHQDSSLVLGGNGQLLESFYLNEKLREDAIVTVNRLQSAGIQCHILSGDNEKRVNNIAQQLAIVNWQSRQLPADKLSYLKQLHQQQRKIMMVGDGSNDAPVLAGADVSVALTSGAELAQANADILLCDGRLSNLIYIGMIAQQTQKILKQNERWAITYNTLAMPAAALGFIPPWLAAIFMSVSSLVVVLNALRIGARGNSTS